MRWAIVLLVAFRLPSLTLAFENDGLVNIDAGTVVDDDGVAGWSDLVLVAVPRVGSGDTEAISSLVKEHAELLTFVVAARVQRPWHHGGEAAGGSGDDQRATLRQVGVGLATTVDGRLRIVSGPAPQGPTAEEPPQLGMLASQVLRSAQRSLDDMRVVVRRTTLMLYDSPAVVRVGKQNRRCVVRSLLWIEPDNGKLHHVLWVINNTEQRWRPAFPHGVYLPVPFREDRVLHVQADQFTFGIPAPTAIALAALPPGHPFPLDAALEKLACQPQYDEQTLAELTKALVAALRRDPEGSPR